ncbi:hypothetical protein GV791_17770 [Nocardia cyriacigeorgica]|uniref:Secreted protein n=2 Tax=Nocardia cyriacigeorgica TaxID=135487 RepID=H6R148_NOCCG|nr:hypothetical protein [Nocardia cyriacigeorgica]MBF6084685.1 hypothetical protein [Nocardia cyriacigeorgica]MBF6288983.1 hypothetical protein [Nocardia cyriacigeorgica]MBF6428158.1 hypothetical protein [Nocardia cyriacigeorgica]NEW34392.1 hypothetical protein [Nocardia cyriacigeorgica]CCF63020.1 exported protein of unknown function [Nocardia cyriacigeorgica GUH-2]
MKRTFAAVAVAAALLPAAQLATATTASAAPQQAFVDGPMLGSADVGCGAQGCTSPLVKFLLIDLPQLLGSGSAAA